MMTSSKWFYILQTRKNGKNRNQRKIISNQLFHKQSNFHRFNSRRWRIPRALFKITFQNKKRCIEKMWRTCKIILSNKTRKMKKNIMVWFPRKKTFWNSTTDNEKWLILAWINLALAVYFSIFAIGFGLFLFNCFFVYKWTTKS